MIPTSTLTPTVLNVQAVTPGTPAAGPRDGDRSAFGRELQRATGHSESESGDDRADESSTRSAAEPDVDARAPGTGADSRTRADRSSARRGDHGARATTHASAPPVAVAHVTDPHGAAATRGDDEAPGSDDAGVTTANDLSVLVPPLAGHAAPTRCATAGAPADEDAEVGSSDGSAMVDARTVATARGRVADGVRPELASAAQRSLMGRGPQPHDTVTTGLQMPQASARAYETRAASEGLAVAAEAIGTAGEKRSAFRPDMPTVPAPSPVGPPVGTSEVATPSVAAAAAAIDDTLLPDLHTREFAHALGARLAVFARDGVDQARLSIHPADMGPIAVRLALDGLQVRVDLMADFAATRQVLEQALPSLASALSEAGFTLSGGGVFQNPREGRMSSGAGASRAGDAAADADPSQSEDGRPTLVTHRVRLDGLVDLYA